MDHAHMRSTALGCLVTLIALFMAGCGTTTLGSAAPATGTPSATNIGGTATASATAAPLPSTVVGSLSAIHMFDTQHGVATEQGLVMHTVDGGQTWYDISPPAVHAQPSVSPVLVATAPAHMWVASEQDRIVTIAHTTDGGQTWQQVTLTADDTYTGGVHYLQFIDDQHGWLSADAGAATHQNVFTPPVYRTTDGGQTWSKVGAPSVATNALPADSAHSMTCQSVTVCWATGRMGSSTSTPFLYKSTDGGMNWAAVQLSSFTNTAWSASIDVPHFFDATHGVLPVFDKRSATSAYYTTTDGGTRWQPTTTFAGQAGQVAILDATHWWQADTNDADLFVTSDGGQHWTTLTPGVPFDRGEYVDFVSASTGWAVGKTSLLRSTDGGQSWTVLASAPASS